LRLTVSMRTSVCASSSARGVTVVSITRLWRISPNGTGGAAQLDWQIRLNEHD
jgi:hypothetical protein